MKKRIIDCTIEQFETIGLRKFTMDLIAAKLRISKRTLYLYFSSKEQLIEVCLKEWLHRKRLLEQNGETLIDDLCALYFGIQKIDLQRVACCCRELRQSYISVYQLIIKQLFDYAAACGARTKQDVEAGYLCRTITPHTVFNIISDFLMRLFGNDQEYLLYKNYTISPDMLVIFARGLCTIKGRAYLEQRLKTLA